MTATEADEYRSLATTFRVSLSGLVRRAVRSVATQRPVLTPLERDELHQLFEQLRRAGGNLNTLLRNLHLYGHNVQDRPPPVDELEATANALRAASADVYEFLRRHP